jgi:hypothetical protein
MEPCRQEEQEQEEKEQNTGRQQAEGQRMMLL